MKTDTGLFGRSWLLWLVWKYIQGRSKVHSGSSLWLAVLGILIGVTTLIAVLTGMSGLQNLLTDSIDEVTASHLQIIVENKADSLFLKDYLQKKQHIVKNITRYRETPMLLNTRYGKPVMAIVRAVEVASFMADSGRNAVMQTMGPVLPNDLQQPNRIWVGRTSSYENNLTEGETLQVISAEYTAGQIQTKQHHFLISAIYRLSNPNIEKNYVFIGLNPKTEKLFYSNEYYLGLKLKHQNLANSLKSQLTMQLQTMKETGKISTYQVRTGREANRAFFNALQTEKSFLQLLVSLIFLLVALQIFQATRRTVYARIPELMLLRALGANPLEIRSIFLLESLFIGLLGIGLGSVFGILISQYINEILLWISQWFFYSQNSPPGLLPTISTNIVLHDVLIVTGSAVVFSSTAGWLATRKLLHLQPVEILRNE